MRGHRLGNPGGKAGESKQPEAKRPCLIHADNIPKQTKWVARYVVQWCWAATRTKGLDKKFAERFPGSAELLGQSRCGRGPQAQVAHTLQVMPLALEAAIWPADCARPPGWQLICIWENNKTKASQSCNQGWWACHTGNAAQPETARNNPELSG